MAKKVKIRFPGCYKARSSPPKKPSSQPPPCTPPADAGAGLQPHPEGYSGAACERVQPIAEDPGCTQNAALAGAANVWRWGEVFGPGNACPWEVGPTSLQLGLLYAAADGRRPQTLPSRRSDPTLVALDSRPGRKSPRAANSGIFRRQPRSEIVRAVHPSWRRRSPMAGSSRLPREGAAIRVSHR